MFDFFKKLRYATRSPKWSEVRKEHIKKNPKCIACGKTSKLEVHHIFHLNSHSNVIVSD